MRYLEKEIKVRQMEHIEKAIEAMPSVNTKKRAGLVKSKSREAVPTKKLVVEEFDINHDEQENACQNIIATDIGGAAFSKAYFCVPQRRIAESNHD